MNAKHPRDRICKLNVAAQSRLAANQQETRSRAGEPLQPGDLFIPTGTEEWFVEWLVVRQDRGRLFAVPADTQLFVGSADVRIPEEATSGPLCLRCRFGEWLDVERYGCETRSAVVHQDYVDLARRKVRQIDAGDVAALPSEEDAEASPDYQEWGRTLEELRKAVRMPAPVVSLEDHRKRPIVISRWLGLAASALLAVSLGLTGRLLWQGETIATLREERRLSEEALQEQIARAEQADAESVEWRRRHQTSELDKETAARKHAQETAELTARLEAAQRRQPRTNPPLSWLLPNERDRPLQPDVQTLTVSPETSFLWVVLQVIDTEPFATYRVEFVRERNGEIAWSTDGLTTDDARVLRIALPRDWLETGRYRIRLAGIKEIQAKPLGEYSLNIELE